MAISERLPSRTEIIEGGAEPGSSLPIAGDTAPPRPSLRNRKGELTEIDLGTDDEAVLKRILDHPILTADEVIDLAKQIERGNLNAKNKLIEHNYLLVPGIARQYMGLGLEFIDLFNEGVIGLIRAVEKFDYRAEKKFSTYAVYWIEQRIREAVKNKSRLVRLPQRAQEHAAKIRRVETAHIHTPGVTDEPSVHTLSQITGLPLDKVAKIKRAVNYPSSLDKPVHGITDNAPLGHFIENDEPPVEEVAIERVSSQRLYAAIRRLPADLAYITYLRYGFGDYQPHSYEALGIQLGISRQGAKNKVLLALKKLEIILENLENSSDTRQQLIPPPPAVGNPNSSSPPKARKVASKSEVVIPSDLSLAEKRRLAKAIGDKARADRSEFKKKVKSGMISPALAIGDPLALHLTLKVFLGCVPMVGEATKSKILSELNLAEETKIGALVEREKKALIGLLPDSYHTPLPKPPTPSREQSGAALKRANEIRTRRAEIKKLLSKRSIKLSEVIDEKDMASAKLGIVLSWLTNRKDANKKKTNSSTSLSLARKILSEANLSPDLRINQLEPEQRKNLLAKLSRRGL